MTDDESRKAFEETISAPPFELDIDRYPDDDMSTVAWPGNYRLYGVHLSWDVWQAAVEFATKREQERCINWIKAYSINSDRAPDMLRMIRSGE